MKLLLAIALLGARLAFSADVLPGDEAFKLRKDPIQAQKALDIYRTRVSETAHKEASSLSRLSMACYFVGLRNTKNEDDQIKIFREGRDAGLEASELDHSCADCRFWAAINMALYGQRVGVFKMLFSLSQIQDLLKQSVALNPTYAYSGAQRLLGSIYQKIPGIIGGDNSRAQTYFEHAIQSSPDEPLNYLFLAQLMQDEFKDPKAALAVAQKGLLVQEKTNLADDRLESIEALDQLKALEKKLRASTTVSELSESR
jgi:hypothetical protein